MKLRRLLLLVLACVMFSSAAAAQPLVMATGQWRPYTSSAMQGYGKFTRMVSAVLREMGRQPEYRFYPWARCYDAVVKGRVWAAFPYSYTRERAQQVWYSEPLSVSRTLFFYYEPPATQKHFTVHQLSDLRQYRVGGVTGYFYKETFRKADLHIDYANSELQGLEKLVLGRIDLMPLNEKVGWSLIKRHFPSQAEHFKTLDYALGNEKLALIVSRKYPRSRQLLDAFNAALQRCREKGTIKSP